MFRLLVDSWQFYFHMSEAAAAACLLWDLAPPPSPPAAATLPGFFSFLGFAGFVGFIMVLRDYFLSPTTALRGTGFPYELNVSSSSSSEFTWLLIN